MGEDVSRRVVIFNPISNGQPIFCHYWKRDIETEIETERKMEDIGRKKHIDKHIATLLERERERETHRNRKKARRLDGNSLYV